MLIRGRLPAPQKSVSVRRRPDGVVVALVVAFLSVYHVLQGWGRATPWIFPDEAAYINAARALWGDGPAGALSGQSGGGLLHLLVLGIAWIPPLSAEEALTAGRVITACTWSLAAIPVFLMARPLAGRGVAAVCAAGACLVPASVFSSSVMQEPVAYPAAAFAIWLMARFLARPSGRRAISVAIVLIVAWLARSQLGILTVTFFIAIAVMNAGMIASHPYIQGLQMGGGVTESSQGTRARARLRLALLAAIAVSVAGAAALSAGGHSWGTAALSAFRTVGAASIGAGVLPIIALLISLGWIRAADERLRALGALAAGATTVLLFYVAVKAHRLDFAPITVAEERNVIYVYPLAFVAMAGCTMRWRPHGLLATTTAAVIIATAIASLDPRQVWPSEASSENPGGAWLGMAARFGHNPSIGLLLVAVLALAGAVIFTRRGSAIAAVALTAAIVAATGWFVYRGEQAFSAALKARQLPADPSFLDTAADRTGAAIVVPSGTTDLNPVWLLGVWNRSVRKYAHVDPIELALPGVPGSINKGLGLIDVGGARLIAHSQFESFRGPNADLEPHGAWSVTRFPFKRGLRHDGQAAFRVLVTGVAPDGWIGHKMEIFDFVHRKHRVVAVTLDRHGVPSDEPLRVDVVGDEPKRPLALIPPNRSRSLLFQTGAGSAHITLQLSPVVPAAPDDPREIAARLVHLDIR